jgi:hypothetical protein
MFGESDTNVPDVPSGTRNFEQFWLPAFGVTRERPRFC